MHPTSETPDCASLVGHLRNLAAGPRAEIVAYTFVNDRDVDPSELTYSDLERRARGVGAELQRFTPPGERAVLIYPPSLEFVAGFFGCLFAGVVAVPCYPPTRTQRNASLLRLESIASDCRPTVVLCSRSMLEQRDQLVASVPSLAGARWLATDCLEAGDGASWSPPSRVPDDIVMLQYTSGSTGDPKGVALSEANLIANQRVLSAGMEQTQDAVAVGWLPMYHDMGLLGNVLHPFYLGARSVLLSPIDFIRRPARWLRAISDYGGTISGGPNFGFALCVQRVTPKECKELDLSSWRVAFCGAEPIDGATLESFSHKFAPFGLTPRSFYPCYGLAEATLMVSGGHADEPPVTLSVDADALQQGTARRVGNATDRAQSLVSCGFPREGHEVRIVDPDSLRTKKTGQVGEIWVRGPSVARGYWGKGDACFGASLADGAGGYLRTGDLGFSHQNQLFVTGRIKEVMIVDGRNVYPQDIERAAILSNSSPRPSASVSFQLGIGSEASVVLVQEIRRKTLAEWEEVIARIRAAVARDQLVRLDAVVLVPPRSIPKTSSGKPKRRASADLLRTGSFRVLAEWWSGKSAPPK